MRCWSSARSRGTNAGLYVYDLTDPRAPTFLDSVLVATGIHTATVADIGGHRYVFAARNPENPALIIYDISVPSAISVAATVPIPPVYGIHDTFVRDGLAFVFAWNTGVIIYDVGNGIAGGSPTQPIEVSRLLTAANGVAGGPQVHNGWWFHNPVRNEQRYLFIGQEGPGVIGSKSAGDLHVVDVADLAHPQEVAFFHLDGAGTHNFWMDEDRQILYMAYYNGGVVALDVSGELSRRSVGSADRADSAGRGGGHVHLGSAARRGLVVRDRYAQRALAAQGAVGRPKAPWTAGPHPEERSDEGPCTGVARAIPGQGPSLRSG